MEEVITLDRLRADRTSGAYRELEGRGNGRRDDSMPATGYVGEHVSSTVAVGSAVSLTNNTAANVTSITLTSGDWDVWTNAYFTGNAATTVSYVQVSISETSATMDETSARWGTESTTGATIFTGGAKQSVIAGPVQVSVAAGSTKTIYMVVLAGFGTSTASAYGKIAARRRS